MNQSSRVGSRQPSLDCGPVPTGRSHVRRIRHPADRIGILSAWLSPKEPSDSEGIKAIRWWLSEARPPENRSARRCGRVVSR